MITVLKIIWIFWAVVVKLVSIGCAGYIIERVFGFLETLVDRTINAVAI